MDTTSAEDSRILHSQRVLEVEQSEIRSLMWRLKLDLAKLSPGLRPIFLCLPRVGRGVSMIKLFSLIAK